MRNLSGAEEGTGVSSLKDSSRFDIFHKKLILLAELNNLITTLHKIKNCCFFDATSSNLPSCWRLF